MREIGSDTSKYLTLFDLDLAKKNGIIKVKESQRQEVMRNG